MRFVFLDGYGVKLWVDDQIPAVTNVPPCTKKFLTAAQILFFGGD